MEDGDETPEERQKIEKAEALWAEALAARQKADALSAEAEELSAETAVESEGMNEKLSGEGTKFSLSMIGDARVVMDTAIDAQKLITDAVAAAELADQLEADAAQRTHAHTSALFAAA